MTDAPPMSPAEQARRWRFTHVFMATYYAARHADLMAMEAATAMYATEVAEYKERWPPIVFKTYLIASRGMPR